MEIVKPLLLSLFSKYINMAAPNSIVIIKEANGNVTISVEGVPYTLLSESYITKQLTSVIVRGKDSTTLNKFYPEEVEKIIRDDMTEIIINDNDTLYSELSTFFFFKSVGSGGGGTIPGLAFIVKSKNITQSLSKGDNNIAHNLGKNIISFSVKDGDDIVDTTGNDVDMNNFNINLSGGSGIVDADIYLNYQ